MSNSDAGSDKGSNGKIDTDQEVTETQTSLDPLAALKAELEEQKKQNLYYRADFENFRRQSIKERAELLKFGAEPMIREFLNVFDNLERAASAELTPETIESYKSGIDMIVGQFQKTLNRFGIDEVDSLHQPFDPNQHEALTSEDHPSLPPGVVTKVFKKGFKLHGKTIRPAQVVVNTSSEKKG